jgi:DNA-binding NtrC family response regulator
MQILVIDPDAFLAENICAYLGAATGTCAEYVTSVEKGLERLSFNVFDLVISDIVFPNHSNPKWLLKIGKLRHGQKIIIISSYSLPEELTAFSVPDELMKNELINIIGYYEKPFDIKILHNCIKAKVY